MAWGFVAAGAITAIGGAISASDGKSAASDAANAESQASAASIAEQRREYDQTRSDQAIYRDVGGRALNRLNNVSDGNLSSFKTSPNYAWTLSQGQKGIQQSAAAQGGLYSGNALKALTDYNQQQAAGQYNNWWNQNAGLAGVGQSATNAVDQFGQQTANNISNSLQQQGDSRASGIIGGANSLAGGINSGIQNGLGIWNAYNNYQQQGTNYLNTPIDTSYAHHM